MGRIEIATQILSALVANPERYKYIADMVANGMTQEEATLKNVRKALKIADALIEAEIKDTK